MGGRYGTYEFRQSIPRPASAVAGRAPTWAALDAELRRSLPIDRFAGDGNDSRPAHDPASREDDAPATFAVLVPLFPIEGEATVLLIRRSSRLRRDAGHVAFPGGRLEPGESPLEGALRETAEEIGLASEAFSVLRRLPLVERGGERIAAYLGLLSERPALQVNRDEVDAVIEVPLVTLLADGAGWQERWSFAGQERRIHFFADPASLGDDLIWGLTAGILWSLLEGTVGAAPEPPA